MATVTITFEDDALVKNRVNVTINGMNIREYAQDLQGRFETTTMAEAFASNVVVLMNNAYRELMHSRNDRKVN